jgi:hypothetical protein
MIFATTTKIMGLKFSFLVQLNVLTDARGKNPASGDPKPNKRLSHKGTMLYN